MKGIEFKDTNIRSTTLAKHLSQMTRENGFLLPKVQIFQKHFFVPHHPI
jgi:hypothetical protein